MNVLPVTRQRAVVAATLGVVGLFSASQAMAANSSWLGTAADANFANAANWSNGVPGSTNPTSNATRNTDIATFAVDTSGANIGTAANPILWDNTRFIKGITFDTGAGSFHLGSQADTTNLLYLDNAGSITMNAGVTNSQFIDGLIRVRQASSTNGTYSFVNNATTVGATLNITNPTFTLTNANGRPTTLTLDGSNTGANIISSNITNALGGQNIASIIKQGSGTWILSGSNSFTINSGATTQGIQINGGVLSARNDNALGTASTGTANQVSINSGGTLEVAGGINLATALIVNLNNGGTLQSLGTNTVNSALRVGTAAGTVATIRTVNSGDVLTLGDATNDFTGGAADSVVNIAGPGTVVLSQTSNYAGGFSLNSGTLRAAASNALGAGTGPLNFGAASTGVLQVNGQAVVVGGLNSNATPGSPVVENGGNGGFGTLTVNNPAASSFGGLIRDGSNGVLALTKTGVGSLALTGANTYAGGTTISGGTLLANNGAGSATGTGSVTVAGNGTLGGTGTVGGAVTVNSNGHLAPGSGGVGTLRVSTLTLDAGSQLDYDVTSPASTDQTIVTTSGGLTINGGQFNFNGGVTQYTTNGVYNLIGYTGSINGSGISALSLNSANKNLATNTYTFGTAGGYVTLTVASSGGTISYWNADANGTWTGGPWTPSQPNAVGAFASFGGGGTAITADRTITVDANKTVGTIAFNNANSGKRYTIANSGGASITLNNGAGNASFITDTAGSHTITAPLVTTSGGLGVTVSQAADTLTIGGTVSGPAALTKSGLGTLALTGSNTYTGGTTLSIGTLQISSADSLGDVNGALNFTGGTLQLLADVTSGRTYNTDANGTDVKIDTNGHTLIHNGAIAINGASLSGLTKSGAGTLILNGTNTYAGPTTITGGTVSVSNNNNLGDVFTGAAVNLNGGTLATTGTFNADLAFSSPRNINVGATGGTIDVADTTTFGVSGLISGGTLTKTGPGTLALYNTGNSSPMTISGGTVTAALTTANTNGGLGGAPITLQGGATINSLMPVGNSWGIANAITVPTGQTGTIVGSNRFSWGGTVTGGGTLNAVVNTTVSRFDFNNNMTGFSGTLALTGSGSARLFNNGGSFNTNSFQNLTLDLGGSVNIAPVTNSTGNTYQIGALTGTSTTASLGGGSAGSPTYTVGGLNTSTTYAGLITGNAILTKVGSGSLTITGANQYTGLTNVNGGTLVINGQFALGGGNYAGITFNGGQLGFTANVDGTNGNTDITADSTGVAKPVTLNAGGGTINTNGNTVTFANPIGGTGAFTKAGAGTLTFNATNTYAGATNVTGGSLVSSTQANTAAILANTNGINVAGGQIVLNYDAGNSPAASIRTLLQASFQDAATPGVMDTGTIRSTTATLTRGLGYKDDGTGVTIKATLFGDADLDGGVSINDFNALAGNFGKASGQIWVNGDFDYDGGVSINDFNLLAGNFGKTTPVGSDGWDGLIAFAIAHNDLAAFQAVTGVPEPTTLGLLAAGATLGLRRRRRSA